MNPDARPASSWRRRLWQVLDGSRSAGLYVVGALVELMSVGNVPGGMTVATPAARSSGSGYEPSDLGTLLALLGFGLWVTVFFRRRAPWAPIVAGAVLTLIGTSYTLLLVGLVNAALLQPQRMRRWSWLAGAGVAFYLLREFVAPWGGSIPAVFGNSRDPHSLGGRLGDLVIAPLALAAAAGIVALVRARGDAQAQRTVAHLERTRVAALSDELSLSGERERLARDIHDSVAHGLSAISLQAGALEIGAPDGTPAQSQARNIRELAHRANDDLRTLLRDLRHPAEVAMPGSVSMKGIARLLEDARSVGARIDSYVMVDDASRASDALSAAVFRLVQESLTNARKHAPGAPVSVFVEVSAATGARVRISNPLSEHGTGLSGSGSGVLGLRQRVEALGGTLWSGTHDDAYIVDASLPWQARESI